MLADEHLLRNMLNIHVVYARKLWQSITCLSLPLQRCNDVIDMLYYNPVMLARRLSTLDVLSNGRLRVGMGLGWSKDEFDAMGVSLGERGARADEFMAVLKAIWTSDPVEFQGKFYRIPRSVVLQTWI
jgi:luciferase-like monooxygenase